VLRWLPTLGSVAVLAVAALLAAGAPAGRNAPGSATPQPARGAPAPEHPVILVLVDTPEDISAFLTVDPALEAAYLAPQSVIVVLDAGAGGGFSAEAARELAEVEVPFQLVDLRGH
jgi:hypothetical protein